MLAGLFGSGPMHAWCLEIEVSVSILEGAEKQQVYPHFTDEAVLINRSSLLPSTCSWCLRPHFLHVLQYHIAMPVECFHTSKQLSVVSARNEDLCVGSNGGLKDR